MKLVVDRPPTNKDFQRFRLILSTFQDRTGMLAAGDGKTLPGWRDFERAVALTFDGYAAESKHIFDVHLEVPGKPDEKYGISCKMRGELNRVDRDGRVTIELSNSVKKFWAHLETKGINQINYKSHPKEVGAGLIELVQRWHNDVSLDNGEEFSLENSCYLVLSWNREGCYQLHMFPLELPNPDDLNWYFPKYERNGEEMIRSHLTGDDESGAVFQWYGESGGQLKYYPMAKEALWESERFCLQPLPENIEHGILHKLEMYFPELWSQASG